jgi:hypothetical protein
MLFVVFATPSYAADTVPKEIGNNIMKEKIVNFANTSALVQQEISTDDVDFLKAVKVYLDTDIFKLKTNSVKEMVSALEKGEYIYCIPIPVNKTTTLVAILSIGLPLAPDADEVLTEQQIREIVDNEGKWIVEGVQLYDKENPYVDYYAEASRISGIKNVKPYLLGGLNHYDMPVALFPDENNNISKMIPMYPNAVEWSDLGIIKPASKEIVFNFSEVKTIVNSLPKVKKNGNSVDSGGGESSNGTVKPMLQLGTEDHPTAIGYYKAEAPQKVDMASESKTPKTQGIQGYSILFLTVGMVIIMLLAILFFLRLRKG